MKPILPLPSELITKVCMHSNNNWFILDCIKEDRLSKAQIKSLPFSYPISLHYAGVSLKDIKWLFDNGLGTIYNLFIEHKEEKYYALLKYSKSSFRYQILRLANDIEAMAHYLNTMTTKEVYEMLLNSKSEHLFKCSNEVLQLLCNNYPDMDKAVKQSIYKHMENNKVYKKLKGMRVELNKKTYMSVVIGTDFESIEFISELGCGDCNVIGLNINGFIFSYY